MDKKQKILLLIIGVLVIIAVVIGVLAFKKEKNNPDHNKVNKFKEEFEVLNGTTDKDGYTYPTVEIDIDSEVEYVNITKTLELIDNSDSVIMIGNSQNFLSRNAIGPLLSAIESNSIEKLYYLDADSLKDNSSEEYLKLMEKLNNILNKKEVKNEEGNKVGTIKQEIYVPTVIVVSNGEIVDFHIGTLESNMTGDNKKEELTKEEKEDLFEIYSNMVLKISDASCNEETEC